MANNSQKRVLLLNPPASKKYLRDCFCSKLSSGAYYWQPSDLAVLSGILNKNFNLFVIDAIIEKKSLPYITNFIKKHEIDIVISLIGSASINQDLVTLKSIKGSCNCYIAVSGDIVLDEPEKTFGKWDFIDAMITDFTSMEIISFLNAIPNNKKKYLGINYRNNLNQIIVNHQNQKTKIISFPSPRHDLFPLKQYQLPFFDNQGVATVSSSFGCPYSCDFCVLGTQPFLYRSTKDVVKEIKNLTTIGVKQFIFRDPLFEANINRAKEICQAIIDNNLKVYWSCNSRVDTVLRDPNLLPLMKQAGCTMILFGVESGTNSILKSVNKRINISKIKKAFSACQKHQIPTSGYFILGLPEDNSTTIKNTINLAIELNPSFAVFSYLSPDYKTKLREQLTKQKIITDSTGQQYNRGGGKNTAMPSKYLTSSEIEKYQKFAFRKYYLRWGYLKVHIWRFLTPKHIFVIIKEFISLAKKYFI